MADSNNVRGLRLVLCQTRLFDNRLVLVVGGEGMMQRHSCESDFGRKGGWVVGVDGECVEKGRE